MGAAETGDMIRQTPATAAPVRRPAIGMVDVLYQPPLGTCIPPADALAEMDWAGVAVAMVSQCKKWSCERQYMCVDTRLEDVARFVQTSVRFAGLAGYNPFDASESVREIEAARTLGFRGTYFHCDSFGLRLTDARLYPLFAKCAEAGLACVVQVPFSEPDLVRSVERICRDFPELSLAIAHPRPEEALFALCEEAERLGYVLDSSTLAWMFASQRSRFDDPLTVERWMWGSNGIALSQSAMEVLALDLSLETLEAIVRTNALRFFAAASAGRTPQSMSQSVIAAER